MTNQDRLLPRLNEPQLACSYFWTKLGRAPPPRFINLCCLLVLFGGCALVGPPNEVYHPHGVDIQTNFTFTVVNGRELKLDLYVPHGAQGRLPLVMWIHGGGWLHGSRHPCPIARLATRGYVVAAVDYRHSGVAPFPAQLDDVKAGLSWICQNPDQCHADLDHLGVWGASAGGTLACLLGLTAGDPPRQGSNGINRTDNGVKCVVAFFPATDLERLFKDEFPVSWEMRYAVRHLLGGVEPKDNLESRSTSQPSLLGAAGCSTASGGPWW